MCELKLKHFFIIYCRQLYVTLYGTVPILQIIVSDPHTFYADPDPDIFGDSDPDPDPG